MTSLRSGSATDAGLVRSSNQDRMLVIEGELYAIADGMGGHRGGEVAAQITVDTLRDGDGTDESNATHNNHGENTTSSNGPRVADDITTFVGSNLANDDAPSSDLVATATATSTVPRTTEALLARAELANRVVLDRSRDDPELSGMGTTLTAMTVLRTEPGPPNASGKATTRDATVGVVNIGDSRLYRLRSGFLEQITEDHTVAAEFVRDGRMSADEARTHRQRSVLTRAIGVEPDVDADTLDLLIAEGDRLLLCSDGLYSEVPDDLIGSVLRRLGDPEEAAKELVQTALQRGGRDNVSVIVVDVLDDDEAALRASNNVRPTITPSASPAAPTTRPAARAGTVGNTIADEAVGRKKKAKRARRPAPINLRVLFFMALLAALGAVVFWVVKNAPKDEPVVGTTSGTEIVESTVITFTPSTLVSIETQVGVADTTPSPASSASPASTDLATDAATSTIASDGAIAVVPLDADAVTTTLEAPPSTDPFAPEPPAKNATKRKTKKRSNR